MNTVKTTAVAKTSVSSTVVTSGPHVSTGAVTLNGSADLATPSHSMPTSLSQERTTPVHNTFLLHQYLPGSHRQHNHRQHSYPFLGMVVSLCPLLLAVVSLHPRVLPEILI